MSSGATALTNEAEYAIDALTGRRGFPSAERRVLRSNRYRFYKTDGSKPMMFLLRL